MGQHNSNFELASEARRAAERCKSCALCCEEKGASFCTALAQFLTADSFSSARQGPHTTHQGVVESSPGR